MLDGLFNTCDDNNHRGAPYFSNSVATYLITTNKMTLCEKINFIKAIKLKKGIYRFRPSKDALVS